MSSIRFKLLATLLAATSGLVLCMYLVMQWSFDRGFLAYINAQESPKYEALVRKLSQEWQQTGSWERIQRNRRSWEALSSEALGIERPQRPQDFARTSENRWDRSPPPRIERRALDRSGLEIPPPPFSQERTEGNQARRPPPPPTLNGIRMPFLLDSDKNTLYGRADQLDNVTLYPITHSGAIVGYVGQLRKKELTGELDRIFVAQQTQAFSWIALVMILIPLFIALPIAAHLVNPIKRLAAGTQKLTAGNYDTVIPVIGKDELGQLSKDFNTLAHTLAENERSRQQWIADISHELRTPIAILKGEIEAMQDGVRATTPDAIASLHSEVEHLSQLVNDLYELSMSDIGALSYKKEKSYPGAVLQETIDSFERVFAKKGINILYTPSAEASYFCLADTKRLKQLFGNLLKNTLRYTDAPGTLEVIEELGRNHVRLHFKDSAPGVAPEALKKLFERLYRVEASRNRALGGAGLGLSICHNIVTAHDGTISAAKSPFGGLWITITLPLCKTS